MPFALLYYISRGGILTYLHIYVYSYYIVLNNVDGREAGGASVYIILILHIIYIISVRERKKRFERFSSNIIIIIREKNRS